MSRREIKGSIENWCVVNGHMLQKVNFDTIDHGDLTLIGIFYSGRLLKGFIKNNTNDSIIEVLDTVLTETGFYGSVLHENRGIRTGYYDFQFNLLPGTYFEYKSTTMHMAGIISRDQSIVDGFIHAIGLTLQQGRFKNGQLHGLGIRHNYLSGLSAKGIFNEGHLVQGQILSLK